MVHGLSRLMELKQCTCSECEDCDDNKLNEGYVARLRLCFPIVAARKDSLIRAHGINYNEKIGRAQC
jgi:hypothetical protein